MTDPDHDLDPLDLIIQGIFYTVPWGMSICGVGVLTWFLYEAIL